jgi:hypothetical protein
VGDPEPGRFDWTDYEIIGDPVARQYYYRIRAASVTGKGYRDSTPFIMEHDSDNIAMELVRKKNTFLTVRGGISTAVLVKKTWGAKCSRCWNLQRMQAEDPDCPDCLGTGFSGGYMNPVYIPALFNPPKKVVIDSGLQHEPYNIYIELANCPLLEKFDVVVDRKQNLRYHIEEINTSTHRMHPIAQIARLNRLDENSIVYSLRIPEPPHAAEGRSWDLLEKWTPPKYNGR